MNTKGVTEGLLPGCNPLSPRDLGSLTPVLEDRRGQWESKLNVGWP